MKDIDKFRELVEGSRKILINSHISPDPDAISSVLLLGTTLIHNYSDNKVVMALEEEPEGLDFLTGYNDIRFGPLAETIKEVKPDLFIMLDAVNYERCSRTDGERVRRYLKDNGVKTVIIDHHEPAGKDDSDVYIHQGSIATTQDVYEACFDHLKLEKPEGYGETTMLGIYSDSGGFIYDNPRHRETFKIIDDLLDAGVSLEDIKNRLNSYSQDHLKILAEFAKNVSSLENFTYTFLSDEFARQWQATPQVISTARGIFAENYLRNINGRKQGFIVCPDLIQGSDTYAVSLRSSDESVDVSRIANKLGGGGHKPAAGAKIEAKSVEEAIQKVQHAISSP